MYEPNMDGTKENTVEQRQFSALEMCGGLFMYLCRNAKTDHSPRLALLHKMKFCFRHHFCLETLYFCVNSGPGPGAGRRAQREHVDFKV